MEPVHAGHFERSVPLHRANSKDGDKQSRPLQRRTLPTLPVLNLSLLKFSKTLPLDATQPVPVPCSTGTQRRTTQRQSSTSRRRTMSG